MNCTLHKRHSPVFKSVDQHHVVPVAWQLTWQPGVAPFPGPDTSGRGMLWDARLLECCATGHRNVHVYIVKLMRAVTDENVDHAIAAAKIGSTQEAVWAVEALKRFQAVGGSLLLLVAAHEWGQS